jgi:hypothetical protein
MIPTYICIDPLFENQILVHKSQKPVEKEDNDASDMGGRRGTRSRTRGGIDALDPLQQLRLRRAQSSRAPKRSASPEVKTERDSESI